MKLIFAVLYVSLTMGLTLVIKQKVFTFIFAVFAYIKRYFHQIRSFEKAEIYLHTTFR